MLSSFCRENWGSWIHLFSPHIGLYLCMSHRNCWAAQLNMVSSQVPHILVEALLPLDSSNQGLCMKHWALKGPTIPFRLLLSPWGEESMGPRECVHPPHIWDSDGGSCPMEEALLPGLFQSLFSKVTVSRAQQSSLGPIGSFQKGP